MEINKWIDIEKEISINLSSDDILLVFDNDSKSLPAVLRGLNDVATFLKGISDSKIAELNPEQQKVIGDFLFTEAERYNKPLHHDMAIIEHIEKKLSKIEPRYNALAISFDSCVKTKMELLGQINTYKDVLSKLTAKQVN